MTKAVLCLSAIVRNEAPVIGRCLRSVRPFIDRWVIVDTGSTDGTQSLIHEHLEGIPGELHERPWMNFEHNRNEALALASAAADYLFMIDADETLLLPSGFERPPLTADAYFLTCEYSGTSYARCAIVRTRLPWLWKGVVHEFLDCESPFTRDAWEQPRIRVLHDGARSRDPLTYLKDAGLLEEALRADPENTRNVFYLAQSYRDAGDLIRSRAVYERRASMGGWDEEVWFSLYQVAVLSERLGAPSGEVTLAYLKAFQARPARAEPLLRLARHHRSRSEFALALLYSRHAATLARPNDMLFVEDDVYRWQALDELSIAGYYAGASEEGKRALEELLQERVYPPGEAQRIAANAGFYGLQP
jgi:glycosyltransferase involved in cell wall biosynthesis